MLNNTDSINCMSHSTSILTKKYSNDTRARINDYRDSLTIAHDGVLLWDFMGSLVTWIPTAL